MTHGEVFAVVRRIPRGRVATYGQVAEAAGYPGAARHIVWALRTCGPDVPWHRVVGAGGEGQNFLNALSVATGADIAASNDATGLGSYCRLWQTVIIGGRPIPMCTGTWSGAVRSYWAGADNGCLGTHVKSPSGINSV